MNGNRNPIRNIIPLCPPPCPPRYSQGNPPLTLDLSTQLSAQRSAKLAAETDAQIAAELYAKLSAEISAKLPSHPKPGPSLYPFTVAGVGTGGYVAMDMRNGTEGTVFSTYTEAAMEARLVLRFEQGVLAPVCRDHSPKS